MKLRGVIEIRVEAGPLTNGVLQFVELLGEAVAGIDEFPALR